MIAVITDSALRGISLQWKFAFKPGKQAHIYFFALKKSEQAEIVAFKRLLGNYNIHFFLFYRRGDQTTRVDSCDSEGTGGGRVPPGSPVNFLQVNFPLNSQTLLSLFVKLRKQNPVGF